MKFGKRLFSVCLSLVMLLSTLGTSALAVVDTDIPDDSKTYTVTFASGGGGSGSMDPVTVTRATGGDTTYTLPVCTFTPPEGKAFAGWMYPKGNNGSTISPAGRTITLTGDITLTAIWGTPITAIGYTLSGYTVGGKIVDIKATPDEDVALKLQYLDSYSRDRGGFICTDAAALTGDFASAVSADSTDTFAAGTTYYLVVNVFATFRCSLAGLTKENVKLGEKSADALLPMYGDGSAASYAVFTLDPLSGGSANQHTITFNANGGSGSMDPVTFASGGSLLYTLPACTFTPPEGKAFRGWEVNGTTYAVGSQVLLSSDTTIKALWGTPVTPLNFTLSGHTRGEKITGITVTPDTATAPLLNDYKNEYYSGNYVIFTDANVLDGSYDSAVADSTAVFAANTDYYLLVALEPEVDYSLTDLERTDVTLNGTRPAEVLRIFDNGYMEAIFRLERLSDGTPLTPIISASLVLVGYNYDSCVTNTTLTANTETSSKLGIGSYGSGTGFVIGTGFDTTNDQLSGVIFGDDETFAADTPYYVGAVLRAKSGHTFTGLTAANIKLNGKAAKAVVADGSDGAMVTVYFELDPLTDGTTPVTAMNFTLGGHAVGKKLTGITVTPDTATASLLDDDRNAFEYFKSYVLYTDAGLGADALVYKTSEALFMGDTDYYLVLNLFAADGYSFKGLTKENVKLGTQSAYALFEPESETYKDVARTVVFKLSALAPNTYTVTFDPGGGSGTMEAVSVPIVSEGDTKWPVPACDFTPPEGKAFAHWSVIDEDDTFIDYALGNTEVKLTCNVTLAADWGIPVTAASYSLSGYTLGAKVTDITITQNSTTPANALSALSGYGRSYMIGTGFVESQLLVTGPIMDETATFAANTDYCLMIPLMAKDGHSLTNLTKENVTLNGEHPDKLVSYGDGGYMKLAVFDLDPLSNGPTSITAVDYSISGYTAGAKITDLTVSTSTTGIKTPATYGLDYFIATGTGTEDIVSDENATFAKNTDYYLGIVVSPEDGYTINKLIPQTGVKLGSMAPSGYSGPLVIFKLNTLVDSIHKHTYDDDVWGKDSTNHWHECTAANCPNKDASKKDTALHVYDNGQDADCNICGYTRTLYAVTVNGSEAAASGAGSYAAGATVTIHAGTRSDCTFNGWTADGVTLTDATTATATFTMPANAVTVTANWQEIPCYTVTFDAGGGSGTMAPVKIPIASKGTTNYLLPNCTFTPPEGKAFHGWRCAYPSTSIVPAGRVEVLTGDTTYTAVWGTPVEAVNFTLNNYAFGSKVTGVTLAKDVAALAPTAYNMGHLIGTGYTAATGALTGGITDTNATLAADTDYYLSVTLTAASSHSLKNLKKENIKLNGVAAEAVYPFGDGCAQMAAIFKLPRLTAPAQPTYETECISDYVAGYHMILVYTNGSGSFSFDDKAMYDVSDAGYKYNDTTAYAHVYATVVKGQTGDTETTLLARLKEDAAATAITLDCGTLDVNNSGTVDLRDAVAVVAVYNGNETYMTQHLPIVLKADVEPDKKIDASDFGKIKAQYLKNA